MSLLQTYYKLRKPNIMKMKSKGDVAGLIKALEFKNNEKHFEGSDVRKNSAEALGELGNRDAVIPLMYCLYDHYVYVRKAAVKSLCSLNGEHALHIALMDEDADICNEAARHLSKTKNPEVAEALVKAMGRLGSMKNSDVKTALVAIGDPAVPFLIPVLKHPENSYLRKDAAWVLKDIGWAPETNQEKIDFLIALQEWDKLVQMGDAAYEDIRKMVKNYSEFNQQIRMKLVYALKDGSDKRFLDLLIQAINDPEGGVRNHAAMALGDRGNPAAVEPLIQLLETCKEGNISSPTVFAAEALGKLGDDRALQPLIHALKNGDKWLREAAAKALGALGNMGARYALEAAFKDRSSRVSSAAYGALDRLGIKY